MLLCSAPWYCVDAADVGHQADEADITDHDCQSDGSFERDDEEMASEPVFEPAGEEQGTDEEDGSDEAQGDEHRAHNRSGLYALFFLAHCDV